MKNSGPIGNTHHRTDEECYDTRRCVDAIPGLGAEDCRKIFEGNARSAQQHEGQGVASGGHSSTQRRDQGSRTG